RAGSGAQLVIGSGCSGSSILLIESAGRVRPGVPNLGLGDRRGNRIEARQSISGTAGRPISIGEEAACPFIKASSAWPADPLLFSCPFDSGGCFIACGVPRGPGAVPFAVDAAAGCAALAPGSQFSGLAGSASG